MGCLRKKLRMKERIFAAIDLGTNSFHMIVVKVKEDGTIESLTREKENVRLGSGSADYETLSDDAILRGLNCLKRFKSIADPYKAEIRTVATSAIREAKNRNIFLEKAKKELGLKIEIASGSEEARLIYLGILQGLPVYKDRILMIDIGGGSTEILIGESGEVLFSQSFKLGAVRLTERFFKKEVIETSDIQKAKFFIQSLLTPIRNTINSWRPFRVIGSSGTISTIAAMILAKEKKTRDRLAGFEFSSTELKQIRMDLNEADSLKKRLKLPGLDEKRAEIIVAGSIILEEIFSEFGLNQIQISETALREGILYDSISSWKRFETKEFDKLDKLEEKTINQLQALYPDAKVHQNHVRKLALEIFDGLLQIHKCSIREREYLEVASSIYLIGLRISHSSYHKHSYYIIKNSDDMVGFSLEEIELIAQIARYHRKSPPKAKHIEFKSLNLEEQNIIKKLSCILRIADGLNRSGKQIIQKVKVEAKAGRIYFTAFHSKKDDPHLEEWAFEERKEIFEEVFGYSSAIYFVGG